MTLINLAYLCVGTRTLGPRLRFVIWVQGCCFRCPGCISPETIPQVTANLVEPAIIAQTILSTPGLEGLTISGGEPMLQAAALSELLTIIHRERDLSIICYTGFTLSQLQAKNTPEIQVLLSHIDVLIDGLYVENLNDNRGWRGSANQSIHFLTPRHLDDQELFASRKRDVEVHLHKDHALMIGVPPQNFSQQFPEIISSLSLKSDSDKSNPQEEVNQKVQK